MREIGLVFDVFDAVETGTSPDESGLSDMRTPRSADVLVPHMSFVWRVLRGLGVRNADLEDLTQRVFVVVASKIDTVRAGSERAYLFSTAVRLASHARRDARRLVLGEEAEFFERQDSAPGPDENADHREELALLQQILDEMPDELRRVFLLCEIEQMTARDASELLEIAPGTVASRLRRAREALRDGIQRAKVTTRRRGSP